VNSVFKGSKTIFFIKNMISIADAKVNKKVDKITRVAGLAV